MQRRKRGVGWFPHAIESEDVVFHFNGEISWGSYARPSKVEVHMQSVLEFGINRGRVDDSSFFDYLSPFCFLLIEFHCSFSISYKILPDYVYYYCISIRM